MEDNAAVSSSNIVRLNNTDVKVVCLSYLALGSSPAHLRHSLKRNPPANCRRNADGRSLGPRGR